MKRVLDYNPITGETVYFHWDDLAGKMAIEHTQDVSRTLDENKRIAIKRGKKSVHGDLLHYARIPNVLVVKWKQELNIDVFDPNDRKKVFSLLNSPEYKYLKTTEATHSG